jgi:hypothetical protein
MVWAKPTACMTAADGDFTRLYDTIRPHFDPGANSIKIFARLLKIDEEPPSTIGGDVLMDL